MLSSRTSDKGPWAPATWRAGRGECRCRGGLVGPARRRPRRSRRPTPRASGAAEPRARGRGRGRGRHVPAPSELPAAAPDPRRDVAPPCRGKVSGGGATPPEPGPAGGSRRRLDRDIYGHGRSGGLTNRRGLLAPDRASTGDGGEPVTNEIGPGNVDFPHCTTAHQAPFSPKVLRHMKEQTETATG